MMLITLMVALLAVPQPSIKPDVPLRIDPAELETFVDGVMREQLIAYSIPGAAVSIVLNGETVLCRGYGYADLQQRIPVDPDSTLFRIGSISKLFVWTSVMQMSEEGLIDLHADVNDYLDFRIPDTYPEPITMAHLLTHTPGFEEQELGTFVTDSSLINPLGEYLAMSIPGRVRPAGELASYSNYGTALAAYIVQRVSGLRFDDYVRLNILGPLSMDRSSFLQPPPELGSSVATGYVNGGGMSVPQPFEWVQAYPAGSMSSTAQDMTAFMLAHLCNGAFPGGRILDESTAVDMHSVHFAPDPRVNGWAWGFMELEMGGDSIIWHGGDTYFFHSALFLLPDLDLGIFATYNCPEGAVARIDLLKAFLAEYHPLPEVLPPVQMEGEGNAHRCAGEYHDIRTNVSTPERLTTLVNPVEVTALDGHTLSFAGHLWIEVEPLAFRNTGSTELLVFHQDDGGGISVMLRGNNPTTSYTKLPTLESPGFHILLLRIILSVFCSFLLVWPVGYVINVRRKWSYCALFRAGAVLGWLMCASGILLVMLLRPMVSIGWGLGTPSGMNALMTLPVIIAVMAVVTVALTVMAWIRRIWTVPMRLHLTLTAAASMASAWMLVYWNLLG